METAAVVPSPLTTDAEHSPPQPSNSPAKSRELQPPLALPLLPPFIDSLAELKSLSSAINAFNQCYEDLHNHLDSIRAAISSKLQDETQNITKLPISCGDLVDLAGREELPKQNQEEQKSPNSELEGLCKTMRGRDLKKYLVVNLSDLNKLREEVPKALKLAPNPSKLVLDCLGRFFLQGRKAYSKDSPMIPAREASVMMLECFFLMMGMDDSNSGGLVIDREVKEEAENAAVAWRKRLVTEGGVAKASEIDARGLLLFVSCFGVLSKLKNQDVCDLVLASNAKEILNVLRKSSELMNKIPEIVEWMISNKMELDAVDLVYTFGLVERFNPQKILMSILRESKATGKRIKKAALGSAAGMLEAKKKQLAPLRSIIKCLEKHEIDPSKLLPGWQIRQKISTLEKDIANFDWKRGEKTGNKRKFTEPETSKKMRIQEPKRLRFSSHGLPQNTAGHVDGRMNMLNGGLPSNVYNYSATPSVVYGGPGAGLIPENMLPPAGADISANHGGVLPTGSYAGVHGRLLVDSSGQVINHGAQPESWQADAALIEKYAGHSSSLGLTNLYSASTSVEGFPGNPNASSAGLSMPSSTSDLYQFADSVVDKNPYLGNISHGAGAVANVIPAPAKYPAYLY